MVQRKADWDGSGRLSGSAAWTYVPCLPVLHGWRATRLRQPKDGVYAAKEGPKGSRKAALQELLVAVLVSVLAVVADGLLACL